MPCPGQSPPDAGARPSAFWRCCSAVTAIDLRRAFRKRFGLAEVPGVSGISIEIDTTESSNDGKAAAFLSRVEFLE